MCQALIAVTALGAISVGFGRADDSPGHFCAAGPARAEALGNFRFSYEEKAVDMSQVPWHQRLFRDAHAKICNDPDVWAKVEELVLAELRNLN